LGDSECNDVTVPSGTMFQQKYPQGLTKPHLPTILNASEWTLELRHGLERFSLEAYLDTYLRECDAIRTLHGYVGGLFDYLETKVSLPSCLQGVSQLQLIVLIREYVNFMTTMLRSTWNMLCLSSTVTLVQRNSTS